jgi:proteic killer suppression protein
MEILFANERMRKMLSDPKALVRAYGQEQARVIARRIADMMAADSLAALRALPGRCHALTGNRAGQFAMELRGPYRLVFEGANDPLPVRADGSLDRSRVTLVRVLKEREDYHG